MYKAGRSNFSAPSSEHLPYHLPVPDGTSALQIHSSRPPADIPVFQRVLCPASRSADTPVAYQTDSPADTVVQARSEHHQPPDTDAEEVKNTYPAEYNLYQRLGIRSVLGASLEPRPVALLAVRNPKRYISETSILRLLAYVLLVAYKDKKMNDGLNMAFAPESIESSHDVFVSLFGELKIYTSHGILREADLKSPKISRLLTYLLISGKKAHSSLEIAQALWPDDSTNPAKNMRNLIYRLRQTFGLISEKELIVSTASGYQFNPDLHIMTDYQQFDDLIQLASKASSVINRVELLKNAIDLYCGKILSSADGEHWLIQFTAKYHIAYVGAVNELLKQLNALHSYDLLNQYAAKSLAIVPENSRGYYWLIHSLKVQGMDELASNEYQLAKQHLTTEEYKELCTSLGDSCE